MPCPWKAEHQRMVLLSFPLGRLFPALPVGWGPASCSVLGEGAQDPHRAPPETQAPHCLHPTSRLFLLSSLPLLQRKQFKALQREATNEFIALSKSLFLSTAAVSPGLGSARRHSQCCAIAVLPKDTGNAMGAWERQQNSWHFWHEETKKWLLYLKGKTCQVNLGLEREKWRAGARLENASCASLLPTWTEYLTQGVTLKFLLEVNSSNSYCENSAYVINSGCVPSRKKYSSKVQTTHQNEFLNQILRTEVPLSWKPLYVGICHYVLAFVLMNCLQTHWILWPGFSFLGEINLSPVPITQSTKSDQFSSLLLQFVLWQLELSHIHALQVLLSKDNFSLISFSPSSHLTDEAKWQIQAKRAVKSLRKKASSSNACLAITETCPLFFTNIKSRVL